jgi:class 3 adenylate cyclase/tetratricopeptide (TPR) repeat protein
MAVTCSNCRHENADDARFCQACGSPIGAPGAARRERKFATALFADLVGSTSLAEREDPEVVQSVVGRAFDRLAREVERYGGLLEKFMGDAVLAVFGVPAAHEDDPERAVRTALEMQAVLSELNRGFASEGRPQLAMRIGIEAGEVLVDLERATGPRDRMLTGDAVNTSARLQTVAEPGRVVVGPAVFASTKDTIDYRDLPPLDLKGKERPVPAWEALRVKARRRGERAPLGLEAKLVGRDEELAVLKQTLHRVEQEGRPALVTVLGPAGVGKSRLTWELLKYAEGLPQFVYWRKGRCLAYGNLSYSALAEAVKAQCEVLEDDTPEVVANKTDRAVEELFGDREFAPHVRSLVGAPGEDKFSREELFEAWRRLLERMAARYPLVLVLEDIHWADAGLLDFIDHMADWAIGPILVVTMARPELLDVRPHWGGGKRNYASIYLDPLTPEENEQMIDSLLTSSLPPELTHLIVERSEGNPLYTEEIVRMFIDRGILRATAATEWEVARPVGEVDVPRSIQGLIAARLDSLPPDEKAVLQDAAVVGRAFWLGAVARLSGRPVAEARETLGRLRVKEILVPREPPTFSGELELAFRHVLIRDVAYESLPKSLRATKHEQVARWAEERAGERAEEMAELLATHYTAAVRYLEELGESTDDRADLLRVAFRWASAAGDRAIRLWQAAEGIRWYEVATGLGRPGTIPDESLLPVWSAYGEAVFGAVEYERAAPVIEAAVELALRLDRKPVAGRMEALLGLIEFSRGRDELAQAAFDRSLALLEPLGDSPELAEALNRLGAFHWRRGRLAEAEPHLRRSSAIAERTGSEVIRAHAMMTLSSTVPDWRESLQLMEEAYRTARDAGDLVLFLRAANNLASTLLFNAPDLDRGERIVQESLDLARKAGHRSMEGWLVGTLGEYRFQQGRLEEAEGLTRESIEIHRSVSEESAAGLKLLILAEMLILMGRPEADRVQEEARELAGRLPEGQGVYQLALNESRRARTRGEAEGALSALLPLLDQIEGGQVGGVGVELFLVEAVRTLKAAGDRLRLDTLRQGTAEADGPPKWEIYKEWIEGLAASDPASAVAHLEAAAARLGEIGFALERARCLVDLGQAEARAGGDPRPTLTRARDLLAGFGAAHYVREAEEALAGVSA